MNVNIAYAIYTQGGGEILVGTLNAVAALVNSNSGSLFAPLMRIGGFVGCLAALMGALWRTNPLIFVKDWMIPFYIIISLLFVPTTPIMVIDTLTHTNQTVKNVPWGLGAFAALVSTMGNSFTKTVEEVFSLPDDLTYQKTGALFASRLVQTAKELVITNEDVKENMREFVGQCVVYDAMLGSKYTVHDLKHSSNIWELISRQASPVRSFLYREPKSGSSSRPRPEIISCKVGAERLNKMWKGQIDSSVTSMGRKLLGRLNSTAGTIDNGLVKREILKNLPVAYAYLLGQSRSAEAIVKQQIMISSIVDGLETKSTRLGNAPNFAARRAYLQQRTTYQTLGDMAAENLPIMKNILEALAYAAFLFVIPLALLPQGWKILSSWAGIVMWLQMWAPLYAVLNFVMNVTARAKNMAHVGLGTNGFTGMGTELTEGGMTIANSLGLVNLNADMSAMAGYLAMSIPFISYALVKGGVGSFVHLASHLSNVSQGSASGAAAEATTGNYSYGNASMGTTHLNTIQAHQTNTMASYQAGGFRSGDGRVEEFTSADGGRMLNVVSSQLPSQLSATESDTNMLTRQASTHAQAAENHQISASESTAQAYRTVHDLAMNQSSGSSVSSGFSQSESAQFTKSLDTVKNITESFAERHGLDSSQSASILASASAGLPFEKAFKAIGIEGKVGGNLSSEAKRSEAYDHAKNITQTSEYKDSMNTITSYAQDTRFGDQDEASKRYSEGISSHLDQARQHNIEANSSLQKAQSFNEAASWSKQNGTSITQNLNDQYVDWLQEQPALGRKTPMGREGAIQMVSENGTANRHMQQRFLDQRQAGLENYFANNPIQSFKDIEKAFEQSSVGRESSTGAGSADNQLPSVKDQASSQGFGDGFAVQPSSQPVASSSVTGHGVMRESIEAGLKTTGIAVTQGGREVAQRRDAHKHIVEQEADQNVLLRPVKGAVSASWNQARELKELIIPSNEKERKE